MIIQRTALVAIAAAMSAAIAPPALADTSSGMIPGGSYLDSCKEVTFDPATNLLNATCDFNDPGGLMAKGQPVRSSEGFDVSGCIPNSIFNDNGSLYCFTQTAWGNGHAIPEGSYRASCTRSRVVNNVLIAECDDSSDETHFAQLDLNHCQWGGDIGNDGGRLRCEPALAAATPAQPDAPQGLIKPVAVQPLVKPMIIAPLAPTEPAATGGEGDGKKKKRRRGERGERG